MLCESRCVKGHLLLRFTMKYKSPRRRPHVGGLPAAILPVSANKEGQVNGRSRIAFQASGMTCIWMDSSVVIARERSDRGDLSFLRVQSCTLNRMFSLMTIPGNIQGAGATHAPQKIASLVLIYFEDTNSQ